MNTTIITFGFKHGKLEHVDVVVDCRALTNVGKPGQVITPELREKVLKDKWFEAVFEAGKKSIVANWKAGLVVGVESQWGHHRSVIMGHMLAEWLRSLGVKVAVVHRDKGRNI